MMDQSSETQLQSQPVYALIDALLEEISELNSEQKLLEKCRFLIQEIAKIETQRYGLTDREAEVWLLRKLNYTYQQIATELFITHHTVKKHLRNIYMKRENYRFLQVEAS